MIEPFWNPECPMRIGHRHKRPVRMTIGTGLYRDGRYGLKVKGSRRIIRITEDAAVLLDKAGTDDLVYQSTPTDQTLEVKLSFR